MHKFIVEERIFMNTRISFQVWTSTDREQTYQIIEDAFQKFHYVVNNFSRFDPRSELSRMNDRSGEEVKISNELFYLIKRSLNLAVKTQGAFDPTIIDILEAYGYNAKYNFEKLDNPKALAEEIRMLMKSRPSFQDILMNEKKSTIKLKPRQRIDLGGIGKGYAIDLAYEVLKPLENFLINAGGDLRTKGVNKEGKPWTISLAVPGQEPIGEVSLSDASIACSGSWARQVKFFHHLIDTRTGKPSNKSIISYIIADNAVDADTWCTALFVMGRDGLSLIKKEGHEGMCMVGKKIYKTEGFVIESPSKG